MPSPFRIIAVLGVLFLTLIASYRFKESQGFSSSVNLETLPKTFQDSKNGKWTSSPSEGLGVRELDILKLDQYVRRYYVLEGDTVTSSSMAPIPINVYVGYWKNQTGEYQGAKHSPSICLPSSGWIVDQRGTKTFSFAEGSTASSFTARQVVGSIMGHKQLFTYWFFSGEQTFYDEWKSLIYISFGALFKSRTDGGIVTLSVPLARDLPEKDAERLAAEVTDRFAQTFAPELSKVLENTPEFRKE